MNTRKIGCPKLWMVIQGCVGTLKNNENFPTLREFSKTRETIKEGSMGHVSTLMKWGIFQNSVWSWSMEIWNLEPKELKAYDVKVVLNGAPCEEVLITLDNAFNA